MKHYFPAESKYTTISRRVSESRTDFITMLLFETFYVSLAHACDFSRKLHLFVGLEVEFLQVIRGD